MDPKNVSNVISAVYGVAELLTGRDLFLKQQYVICQRREYGMLIVRALRGVLKIRYLILGGAVAGGGALQQVNNTFKI
ncbi:hypothetical protein NQ314_018027 [Rhamnusium bicolor]|uniref:Uncharacterized protein n=1 Tax=Rhamnusium bicolor TaxID=1586634 RepID=A0AAV8WRH0_9CUCU|nr:hypothetical protein NQ314_018027 [Rhamnusium bicolor]